MGEYAIAMYTSIILESNHVELSSFKSHTVQTKFTTGNWRTAGFTKVQYFILWKENPAKKVK